MKPRALHVAALGLTLLAGSILVYRVTHLRAQAEQTSAPACCGPQYPIAPRQLEFAYYSLRDGFNSTLLLVGASPKPLDFVMAVHSRSGQTVLAPAMTIQPHQKLSVDLATLLTELSADVTGDFSEGSVSLYFSGTIMPLAGQLTMSDPGRRLVVESETVDNSPGLGLLPPVLNGVWWGLGGGRDARIMVTNTAGEASTADVFLDFLGERHAGPPLALRPHETKVLSIAQLLGDLKVSPAQAPEGGITIIPRGPKPALIALGKVTDPVTGFSSTLEIPDPALEHASALQAGGMPIGTPTNDSPFTGTGTFTPHVIARNLLDTPQTVTITIEYPQKDARWGSTEGPALHQTAQGPESAAMSASPENADGDTGATGTPSSTASGPTPLPDVEAITGRLVLPPLTLAPYSTADFSLGAVMGQLPLPLPYCSIRIQYSGKPGTLIAQVASVDQKQDLVVDARVANEGNGWAGSGANPWHLDEETESTLFLTNGSDQPARMGFRVTAGGVDYYLTRLTLNPHETRAIDIRKLRDAQQPDFKNNKIPADASDGSVGWIRLDNVAVSGRLVVLKRHGGTASGYHCSPCECPPYYVDLYIDPDSAGLQVGDSQQFRAYALDQDCNGGLWPCDVTWGDAGGATYWSSYNPSVATVGYGLVSAQKAGSATIKATYQGWVYFPEYSGYCIAGYMIEFNAYSTVTVYTFTVSLSPSIVQPDGIGGNPNTTVTVQTSPAASGESVSLQDVRLANTGGHPANHPLPHPAVTGTFTPNASGTTDSNGRLQRTYKATIFSGSHQIKATIEGRTQSATLQVKYSGLGQLSPGANYYNSNSPAGQIAHPDNWWGTSATRNGLVATANAYAGQYPGERVPYNDLSLPWGGKFDGNLHNWTDPGHAEHRVGRNADINVCSPWGTQDRRNLLWDLFVDTRVGNASGRLDECTTNNCWHITW